MTKADLIDDVAGAVEMSRKDSEIIVETIFESIVKSLRSGDKIEIRGFGSFRTRQRDARVGVEVPAKKIPYSKPSKDLKDLVNNPPAAQESPAPAAPAAPTPAIPPTSAPATS